jgi:hypothetical protein
MIIYIAYDIKTYLKLKYGLLSPGAAVPLLLSLTLLHGAGINASAWSKP